MQELGAGLWDLSNMSWKSRVVIIACQVPVQWLIKRQVYIAACASWVWRELGAEYMPAEAADVHIPVISE